MGITRNGKGCNRLTAGYHQLANVIVARNPYGLIISRFNSVPIHFNGLTAWSSTCMWHMPIRRYYGINSFLHTSRISECQLGMDCKNYADHVQHRPKGVKGPLVSSLHPKQKFQLCKGCLRHGVFLVQFFHFWRLQLAFAAFKKLCNACRRASISAISAFAA